MTPIHEQVLDQARQLADANGYFRIRDVAAALPHLNSATVRTHVASRCCVNAAPNHASRYPYFHAVSRGTYRLEPAVRGGGTRRRRGWQDPIIDRLGPGVDGTQIDAALKRSPTERLEYMRTAARSLDAMRRRVRA